MIVYLSSFCVADHRGPYVGGYDLQESLHNFRVVTVASGLDQPWALEFLPDGDLLVTERDGRLRRVREGKLSDPITGLPEIAASGQGGLLDVTLHPDFASNRWVYLTYSAGGWRGMGTELARGRLEGGALRDVQVLFKAAPKVSGGRHLARGSFFCRTVHYSLRLAIGESAPARRAAGFTPGRPYA